MSNEFGFEAAVALRLRTTPLRVFLIGAIAVMLWTIGRWSLAPWWFAAYVALQAMTAALSPGGMVSVQGLRRRLHYGLATVNFVVAGAPAWHLWTRCGDLGVAAAVMFLCGMLVQLIVGSLGARRLFWCSAGPLIAYLLVLPPLGWGPQRLADGLAISACSLCLIAYMTALWLGHQRALERGEAARVEAVDARRDAEQAAQAKGAFLATMSHEVRTPMNAVLGAANLLRETPLAGRQVEYVEMISNAGSVLMNVLNDVLDLSKIEAGKFQILAAPADLHGVVGRCVDLWRPQATARDLDFEVTLGADVPRTVSIDAGRLSQILFNLLSNAVKFTAAGSVGLTVAAEAAGADAVALTFTVRDTGRGIEPEALERLFGAFEQADQSISRQFGGTGLGLAISQRLAGLMGGRITVRSELGSGSAFSLVLPAQLCGPIGEPIVPSPRHDEPGAHLRILVAEDNILNRRIVEAFLSPLEASITFAENGVEALEALGMKVFDIVLMDIQMPLMDGIEATRRLRQGGGPNAHTPVIALTANVMEEQCETYLAAGMNTHVAKPIDAQTLLTAIFEVMQPQPERVGS